MINKKKNKTNKAVIVFIKNPILGKVKTRLAATIGDENALTIYKQLISKTQNILQDIDASCYIYYSDYYEIDNWPRTMFKMVQNGNDLGLRMKHAFHEISSRNYDQIIIIGSDCYDLKPSIIEKGFDLLDDMDVVIGPSLDGGYYLLGMNTFHPTLFQEIEWSTEFVCEQTIQQITKAGLNYQRLPLLNDIDTEEDLKKTKLYGNLYRNNKERI